LHLSGHVLVTTAEYFALWKAVEALRTDPGFGIKLVEAADTAAQPPSMLAAFHARDYRDALLRTARFKRLCTPEQLRFTEKKGEFTIRVEWLYATQPAPAIATDVTFASLLELGRRGTGQHLTPQRVEFARSRSKSDIHRGFFGCSIRYGAQRDALVLKCADLDRPFPGHNPELLDMLTPALAAALGELQAHSSISEQVKVVLKKSLASGRPELSEVARELGMSERTLQRRITAAGTSFRDLLVEARQELGRQLLLDPRTEINEVACLLGYQDASSFYRAFRYWEGMTPSRWRELNGESPARAGLH
jgi:AraC-like DNA-binding protein